LIHGFLREAEVREEVEEVAADVAAEEGVGDVGAAVGAEDLLDGPADVGGGVDERAVDVEEVGAEGGIILRKSRPIGRLFIFQ
jgi:hypothetical protein